MLQVEHLCIIMEQLYFPEPMDNKISAVQSATTFNNISVTNSTASPGVSVQSNQNLKGVLRLPTT